MPVSVTCPECDQRATVPDEVAGKRVKCKGCGAAFQVPIGESDGPAPKSERKRPPDPEERDPAPRSRRPRDDEDDESDAQRKSPAKASRKPADADDEEAPTKARAKASRKRDDDDDRGSRRRSGGSNEDEDRGGRKANGGGSRKSKKGKSPVLLLAILGGVVLLGGGAVGTYLLFGSKKLPGDGLEVVTLDASLRQDLLAGKAEARERLQGKVLEIDAVTLSSLRKDGVVVVGSVTQPDAVGADGKPKKVYPKETIKFQFEFPLSDPRNESLKDVGTAAEYRVPVGKVRAVVESVVLPDGKSASGVALTLRPAWLVEGVNLRPGGSTQPSAEESPYTGAGFELLPAEEIDAEIYEPYQMNIYGQWYVLLDLVPNGQLDTKAAQVFLRPEHQSKISDLWPFQRVRIRGQKQRKPLVEGFPPAYFAGEVLSVGPAPPHVTVSAADLLNEFRADHAAAEKKYSNDWAKIAGIVDQVRGETLVLKAGPDGVVPNRIEFRANELTKGILKEYKPGQQVTIRGKYPVGKDEAEGVVIFRDVLWSR